MGGHADLIERLLGVGYDARATDVLSRGCLFYASPAVRTDLMARLGAETFTDGVAAQ